MSVEGETLSHMPKGSDIRPTGYFVKISFAPLITLSKKAGLAFSQTVSDYLDVEEFKLENNTWVFTQKTPGASSRVQLVIGKSDIQFLAYHPANSKEWLENRYRPILARFGQVFKPRVVVSSSAMIHGVVDVDGDARTYLANHLMRISSADVFERPIHGLGVRLFFPPYIEKIGRKKTTVDWQVNLKVESLLEDPGKLFVEADADWPEPAEWSDKTIGQAISHIQIVTDFLKNTVIPYLLDTKRTNDPPATDNPEGEE
jgi:hypothetical protein